MTRSDEMAAQLRRMARDTWKTGDECSKKADTLAADADHVGLRPEGDFEIAVSVLGAPTGRTVTVDAHNLPEALHKAAALPFTVWWDDEDEEGER